MTFLEHQADYFTFTSGLMLVLFGVICFNLRRHRGTGIRWIYLACFGLIQGLHRFIHLAGMYFGGSFWEQMIGAGFLIVSGIFLIEFGRVHFSPRWKRYCFIGFYPGILTVAMLIAMIYPHGFYLFGMRLVGVGSVCAAVAILLQLRRTSYYRIEFLVVIVGFVAYAFIEFISLPGAFILFPFEILISTVLIFALRIYASRIMMQRYLYNRRNEMVLHHGGIFLSVSCILVAGFFVTYWAGERANQKIRDYLIEETRLTAAALDSDKYADILSSPVPSASKGYSSLRKQFCNLQIITPQEYRWFYTMSLVDGKPLFVVDSVPVGQFGHEEPLMLAYKEPPEELLAVFKTGKAVTVGPYTDEWGSFLSGFAPIFSSVDGRVIGALGIDIEAKDWRKSIFAAHFWPMCVFGLLVVLVIAAFSYQQRSALRLMLSRQHADFQNMLLEFNRMVKDDIASVIQSITQMVAQKLDVNRVSIWKFQENATVVVCQDLFINNSALHEHGAQINRNEYPAYFKAFEKERVINAPDVMHDPRTSEFNETYYKEFDIRSLLDVSLWSQGNMIGVLSLEQTGTMRQWSQEEVNFVISCAELISSLVEQYERICAEMKLKDAYAKLTQTQEELVQSSKMAAVGVLASGIAHEVKNPLAIIQQGVTYFDHALPADADEQRRILAMINEAVERADTIIHGLTDFAPSSSLQKNRRGLDAIVENSLLLTGKQFEFRNIELVRELKAHVYTVEVDETKIQQVFVNVIINAIQAMPHGGKLILRIYNRAGSQLKDGIGRLARDFFNDQDMAVVCEIEDTGCGIPQEHLEKVFDPFFTTKREMRGVGLGLSISRTIIEDHQGLITLESSHGEGTKVTIALKASLG
ncbi:MAG TPA: ATP-binding protein [Candidatus Omnitrophota bacterium]|nr:ATP-binding protein [Candidatus Omnitrophota bacterium]HPT06624.1 ATP-binding protein [Candidatus Omnitrophota bacterium]